MNPKLPDIYADAEESLRLALCQIYTEPWDLQGNLARTLVSLSEAAERGAHLAVTPECALHGYGEGKDQPDTLARLAHCAVALDGPEVAQIKTLARERQMAIMLGMAERTPAGRYHNSAVLVSARGEILDVYRKVHCRTFEWLDFEGGFTPGDRFACIDLPYGQRVARVGAMICFDREMPESVRCLRAMGAQLVACPMAWYTEDIQQHTDYAQNEMITRVRAAENEVFIAVVNHAGRFNGGSFVVGPGGEALVQLGAEAQVHLIELPIAALSDQVHSVPYGWMGWGYRRPDVYRKHL